MNLLKTSVLNGVAVLIKTATMFVLNKILAVYVGPAGYATIGQFQNFIQMIITFSGSAINNAIVKYTAEYHENDELQKNIWQTSGTIIIILSFIFSILIAIFREELSLYIFHTYLYKSIFIWLACFLPFFTMNSYFLAILNGKKEVKVLVFANIAGSIFSLIITSILAVYYHLKGALIALSLYQSLAFFVTVLLCYKSRWFIFSSFYGKIDTQIAKKLGAFALMALVSVFFGNLAQILLRNVIINQFGIEYAGYWDAMSRLSNGYLLFASTILGVYYLPKLSELRTRKEIFLEVKSGYIVILPIAIASSIFIYSFKEFIVRILFTDKFIPMLELMLWQLIGDVTKIGSWIVSYMMLSKAMTKLFITTETFFALSIIPLTYLFIYLFSFKGVAIAFFVNCLLYWVVCGFLSNKNLKSLGA
ncbi:O-antigen translocase [Acinetobacter bereziniae]|jgi:PST family polysaccharide transporter|uniref:O-antigen translocase n=1 Tax=Acinetobacter bereziniae TaxID=106648 RepID=UPI00073F431F|nr:O-antigen translocase [Acinetobacter bereziniae]MCU4539275.1 O-antigen translocase [Acinetobacter bereziniae]RSZ24626.1 O-antigen translocase [Acinetobacter bereziniae]